MDLHPPPAPSDVLAGRFELQRVLGTGGMATVWSALDRRLGRTVAVKILRSDLTVDHTERIEREARAAARIDDHRVVTVLDLDHTADGRPFLVFEALSGVTLADELRSTGALDVHRAQRLASDLLGGLGAAHDCGVLHRDVKPSNVLIDDEGFRITDFGIASVDDETATGGDLMGTLVYLAPERFDGAPSSPQADVFSAGAVLYEALSGHQPFRSTSPSESLARLRSGTFAPLPSHVPDRMRTAVTAALDPDPEQRPVDASDFARRVHPPADDRTQAVPAADPTQRLDITARIDQPTKLNLRPPSARTDGARQPEERHPEERQPEERQPEERQPEEGSIVSTIAQQARRPPVIFTAVGLLLLVLLLVAAASAGPGDDDAPPPPPPEDPAEALERHLERIEEIGG